MQRQVIWFVGNSGAGKTHAAFRARELDPHAVMLDGDAMRKVWPGLGFSKEDRFEQNLRIARLAKELWLQGFNVIVSSICPYRELRCQVKEMLKSWNDLFQASRSFVTFIFLDGGREPSEEYPYEGPDENHQ